MLQKLAGRLKWKQVGNGIRVEIPARTDWWIVPFAIFLSVSGGTDWYYTPDAVARDAVSSRVWIVVIAFILIACFFVCWLIWGLTGKTIVLLDQTELKIQRRVLGIEWDERRLATNDAYSLRYTPPTEIWAFRTDTDPNTSKLMIQSSGKAYSFARGITEREACALIDRMMEVHSFPRDRALDQVGITR
jgi:hypothetical protein